MKNKKFYEFCAKNIQERKVQKKKKRITIAKKITIKTACTSIESIESII